MIPRKQNSVYLRSLSKNVREAKRTLKAKGWSYRAACAELGYSFTHFGHVLSGRRQSARLIQAIDALPERPKPQRMRPTAKLPKAA